MRYAPTAVMAGLIGILGLAFASPLSGQNSSPGPCGAEVETILDEIREILDDPDRAPIRDELGLTAVADQTPRLLQGPADNSTCARLRREVPKAYRIQGPDPLYHAVYYQIGNRYVVAIRTARIDDRRPEYPRPDRTMSFDLEFDPVGVVIKP